MAEYKVGGKVVAIGDHPQGRFKKGDIFTVLGIDKSECCHTTVLNVGITIGECVMICQSCGGRHHHGSFHCWYRYSWFIPLEDAADKQITYTKIIEDIPVFAN